MNSDILKRVHSTYSLGISNKIGLFIRTISPQLCEDVESKIIELITDAIGENEDYHIYNFKVISIPDSDLGSNGILIMGDIEDTRSVGYGGYGITGIGTSNIATNPYVSTISDTLTSQISPSVSYSACNCNSSVSNDSAQ